MTNLTLANRLWPETASSNLVRNIVLAVAGSLIVAAAAQITVPFWPVPMTLQTLAVLAVGACYGARLGAATLLLYAVEGAVGLPFFAGGKSGLFDGSVNYLMPAGSMGYVVGFVLAAWTVGKLIGKRWGASYFKAAGAALIGAAALYIPGLIWLAIWAAKVQGIASADLLGTTLSWGLTPFVAGDILKAVIAGFGVTAAAAALKK